MIYSLLILIQVFLVIWLFRKSGRLVLLMLLSIILLNILIVINVYVFTIKGSANDAHYFFIAALDWVNYGDMQWVLSTQFFVQFLGLILFVLNSNEWEVLSSFSVLSFVFSGYLFFRLISQFGSGRYIFILMFLFLYSPNYFIRSGFTLREVYEVLTLVGMIYLFFKYYENQKIIDVLMLLVLALFGFHLHKVFTMLIPIILYSMFVYYSYSNKKHFMWITSLVAIGGIVPFLLLIEIPGFELASALLNFDLDYLSNIAQSKFNKDYSGSYYGTQICFSSISCFIGSAIESLYYYNFYIFPWNVKSHLDIYALISGVFKLVLIINMLLIYKKVKHGAFLMFLFFLITIIWSFGTVNYGTAMRHGVTTFWMLLFFASFYTRSALVANRSLLSSR
jgi:hypothetical protein